MDEFDVLELPVGGVDLDSLDDDPFGYAPVPKKSETILSPVLIPVSDAIIGDLSEKYLGLKVNGINDVKGLARAKEARKECVRVRNLIESSRVELKKPHLEMGKKIDTEAKRLQGLLEPTESYLNLQIDPIERSLKRIEQERLDKLYEKRQNELAAINIMLPEASVRAMTDEEFANLVERSLKEFEEQAEEANRRIEQQKQIDAERAKQKAESDRLAAERAELAHEREELAKQKAATAKAEQDRLDEIEREKRREAAKIRAEQMKPHSEKLRAFADRVEALAADVPQIDPAIDQVVTGFITSAANEMRWIAQGLVSIDSPIPAIELATVATGEFDDV